MASEWESVLKAIGGAGGPALGTPTPPSVAPATEGLGGEWDIVMHKILHPERETAPSPVSPQQPSAVDTGAFRGARGSPYYGGQASNFARMYGIPESLFSSLIDWESGWDPSRKGGSGEIGMTQIMPSTAKGYGVDERALRQSPVTQMQLGARILRDNYNEVKRLYPGISDPQAWNLALAGYNSGMGDVRSNKVKESTLRNYVPGIRALEHSKYGGPVTAGGADPSQPALWRVAYGAGGQQALRAPTAFEAGGPTAPQSLRAPTPVEQRESQMTPLQRMIAQDVVSPQDVARRFGGPGLTYAPALDPLGALQRGILREATSPASMLTGQALTPGGLGAPPTETGISRVAETAGEWAGFAVGVPGKTIELAERIMPGVLQGSINRILRMGGGGALYGALTEIIDRHKDLMRMPPGQAAMEVMTAAGLTGASFAGVGLAGHAAMLGLMKLLMAGGPEMLSVFMRVRDSISPFRIPETSPIMPAPPGPGLGTRPPLAEGYPGSIAGGPWMGRPPRGNWAQRLIAAGGPMGITPKPVQVLGDWMDDINNGFESIWRAYAPREARTVSGKPDPIREIQDQAVGQRDSFVLKSSNQWERRIAPRVDSLSRIAGDQPLPDRESRRLADNQLRGAIMIHFDRMGEPAEFDQFVQDALVKDPRLAPYVERFNRMTPDERQMAETIRQGDNARATHLIMNDVMETARDWHASHIYEPRDKTAGQRLGQVGGKLNPRYGAARQQTYKTIMRATSEGGLKIRSLDIIALNKLNDLDAARAIMAKNIREGIVAEGAGGWYLSTDDAYKAGHTVDLGHMRIFRKTAPIMAAGPGRPGGPEYVQKLASGVDKTVHPDPRELRFFTTPEVDQAIRWMYERDPFQGTTKFENFVNWLTEYNSYMKAVELSYSMFHDFTMAKVYAYMHPIDMLKSLGTVVTSRSLSPYERLYPVAKGMDLIRSENPILMKLVEAGLTLNTPIDAAYLRLIGSSRKFGEDMLLNKYVRAHHAALFEKLQPALKAWDAFNTLNSMLKKWQGAINPRTRLPWTEEDLAKDVASVINDRYGGLNWDRMGTTKMMRTVMRSVMLAPDWTTSNIRLGAKALGTSGVAPWKWVQMDLSPKGWTRWFAKTPDVYLARQALIRSSLVFMGLLQGTSYLLNGHSTFMNDGGRWWMIEMPYRTPDGRKLYVDPLLPGEMRDLIRFTGNLKGAVLGPSRASNVSGMVTQARSKLSPMLGAMVTLFGQTDYAGRPFLDPGMSGGQVLKAFTEQLAPRTFPLLSPIALQPLWQYVNDPTQFDATTTFFRATGLGQVQSGALVPATAWHSLPNFQKHDFLSRLDDDDRTELMRMISEGRISGEIGEMLRDYLQIYHYNLRQEVQQEPPDVRYRPPGVRGPRHQIPIYQAPPESP